MCTLCTVFNTFCVNLLLMTSSDKVPEVHCVIIDSVENTHHKYDYILVVNLLVHVKG